MLAVAMITIASVTACKQAGYQVLRPGAGQSPEGFAESDGTSTPPSARVEIRDRGTLVTWTVVGNPVEVRPSKDTLDPDYIDKSKCDNPGIIQATYDLGNGSKPVVDRSECETLATSNVIFNTPGDYLIQMQVKSLDSEVAWASATLRVVAKDTPKDQIEGGFNIYANPLIANINQEIDFTGICELKGKLNITWDFADSTTGAGATSKHAYITPGQYRVSALCTSDSGKALQASLTVVVMKEGAPKLPAPEIVVPAENPNVPTPPACDPTQGPCQSGAKTPQGTTPGQTTQNPVPTPLPVIWYYDPYCRCYWHYN